MSAMDTSDGPAAEEKKDDPPPPRFEIKKWNAVRVSASTNESRAVATPSDGRPAPTPSTPFTRRSACGPGTSAPTRVLFVGTH